MKILILTVSYSGTSYKGGGWISSMIRQLVNQQDVSVAVAFPGNGSGGMQDGAWLYPLPVWRCRKNRLQRRIDLAADEKLLQPEVEKVIQEFRPDIIHIFGSENAFGLIADWCKTPILIHIQGFLPAYYNAKLPPGESRNMIFLRLLPKNPWKAFNFLWRDRMYRHCAEREINIIQRNKAFAGRTAWDRDIVALLNPHARYFYCSEFLREEFFSAAGLWKVHNHKKVNLISVISPATFKGSDLILKTAAWLKRFSGLDFHWKVFGVPSLQFHDPLFGHLNEDEHVEGCGVATAGELVQACLEADLFIHPSYIDNSPNCVGEAQLLGMPILATNVGGVSSLIVDGETGILVPANDPMKLAAQILMLTQDKKRAAKLSGKASESAIKRHDPERILQDLMSAYAVLVGIQENHNENSNCPSEL